MDQWNEKIKLITLYPVHLVLITWVSIAICIVTADTKFVVQRRT